MPRQPRLRAANIPFHVIQRGHNRSACFFDACDYERYLRELLIHSRHHGVAIHAYVLMTNHVHLLMSSARDEAIGQVMKLVGQIYVQYVNRRYGRLGTLWHGRYRSCLVDTERYLLCLHQYIECNPVRAGMVAHPGDYRWSSYGFNAQGSPNALLTSHPTIAALGRAPEERFAAYRELFHHALDPGLLTEIRSATNGGYALGPERFRRALARTCDRPVVRQKTGPKPGNKAQPKAARKLRVCP